MDGPVMLNYDPIKYVEQDVIVKSGLFSSKKVHIITVRNYAGTNFEIQLDAAKYDSAKLNQFQQELFNRMNRTRTEFNAAILNNTIDAMMREEKMSLSPETVKIKTISQSVFSKLLEAIGLIKPASLLAPAEIREKERKKEEQEPLKRLLIEVQTLIYEIEEPVLNKAIADQIEDIEYTPGKAASKVPAPAQNKQLKEKEREEKGKVVTAFAQLELEFKKLHKSHAHTTEEELQKFQREISQLKGQVEVYKQEGYQEEY